MKKKLFSGVLALALMLSLLTGMAMPASAEVGTAILSVANIQAGTGDTVVVNVSLNTQGTKVKGIQFQIKHDKNVLTLTKIEETSLISGSISPVTDVSKGRFIFGDTRSKAYNGVIAQYTYKVSAGAAIGKSSLEVVKDDKIVGTSLEELGFCVYDVDDNSLTTTASNGSVTVIAAPTQIAVTPATLSLKAGQKSNLTVAFTPSTVPNQTVSWKTSNAQVATVNAAGQVTAVKNGTATLTATSLIGKKTATCKVTVSMASSYVTMRMNKTKAVLNGKQVNIDDTFTQTYPFTVSGRTMLPIRFVATKMGGSTKYISDNDPITITYGNYQLVLKIGSKTMTKYDYSVNPNGVKTNVTLDVAATKRSGRVYIPLRAVGEELGFHVHYDNTGKYIIVSNPKMSSAVINARIAEAKKYF